MTYRVKDITLSLEGKKKIEWAEAHMPVLVALGQRYEKIKPLTGVKISGCLHVTKETAVLIRSLKIAGAELSWCGCNPLSTQDDVAARWRLMKAFQYLQDEEYLQKNTMTIYIQLWISILI